MKSLPLLLIVALLLLVGIFLVSGGIDTTPDNTIIGLATNTPHAAITPTVGATLTPNAVSTAIVQQVNTLQTQYDENSQEIQRLEEVNRDNLAEIERLEGVIGTQEEEIAALEEVVATNSITLTNLRQNNEDILGEIADLETQLAGNVAIRDGLMLEMNFSEAQALFDNPTTLGVNWEAIMKRTLPEGTRLWLSEMASLTPPTGQQALRVNQPGYYIVEVGKVPSYNAGLYTGTEVLVCPSVSFTMRFDFPSREGESVVFWQPRATVARVSIDGDRFWFPQDVVNLIDPVGSPVLVSESLITGLGDTVEIDASQYQERVFMLMYVDENTLANWRLVGPDRFCR